MSVNHKWQWVSVFTLMLCVLVALPFLQSWLMDKGKVQSDLNQSMQNLGVLVAQVMSAASDMRSLTHAITDSNQSVDHRMQMQAADMETTTTSVQQVASTVRESASRAASANGITSDAQKQAAKGEATMRTAIDAMAAVRESSQKVADIVGLIDGIAFQTIYWHSMPL